MQQSEFESLKRTVQRASWELLRAIEDLESLTRKVEDKFRASVPAKRRFRKGQLIKVVAGVVPKMEGGFTAYHVRKEIEKTDPDLAARIKDSSLSATLSRLRTVQATTLGRGRRPTWYKLRKSA